MNRLKCRFIDDPKDAIPGDMWFAPWYAENRGKNLSKHYLAQYAGLRDPIILMLPNGCHWVLDFTSKNGDGWMVTGLAPNLTASPSIMMESTINGSYHGWLRDGYLEGC